MRYFIFTLIFLMSAPVFAQGVDWDKIGRPLGEDTTDIYDRYVYFDETKTADTNVSLAKPLLSLQAMALWIEENASFAMTLSGQNYRREIKDLKPYFTPKGMQEYLTFLNNHQVIATLEQNQIMLSTIVKFTPNILADAVFNDVYRWNVEVPLMLSYRDSNASQLEVVVNVDIVRVPFGKNADGFAFDHWVAKKQAVEADDLPKKSSESENKVDGTQ